MSNCGNCRRVCGCQFQGDGSTTQVLGIGATYAPYQARLASAEFRPVGAAIGSGQSVTLNTDTAITFVESILPYNFGHDMWSVSFPTRLTIPLDGLYLVGGSCGQENPASGRFWHLWIAKNGVTGTPLVKRTVSTQTNSDYAHNSVITLVRLTATDYIELYGRSNQTAITTEVAGINPIGLVLAEPSMIWAQWMGA